MTRMLPSRAVYALLLGVPFLVYWNSLGIPFHYDDFHSIVENPHLRDPGNIPRFFVDASMFSSNPASAMYRPLLLTSFALNHVVSGYAVWSYHLVSVALHLGCVCLVFLVGEMLLGDRAAAALGALIFGVHPINTEAVNYISSRSEVLAGLLLLLALWGFLRWRRGCGGRAILVGSYAAALLSKATGIALPAMLLCYDAMHPGRRPRRDPATYGLLGLVSLVYLLAVGRFLKRATLDEPVRPYGEQFWSQVKAMVLYLKLLLWPGGLSVDHQFLISDSPLDPIAGSAFLLLISLLGAALYHRKRHPLPLFLLSFALLSLAPASLIPLNVLVNEHRLYLPSVALGLGLAWALVGLARKHGGCSRAGVAAALCLVGCYAAATVARNQVWQSAYRLWGDAAAKAPLMARPHFYLGEALLDRGQPEAAIAAFGRAVARDPGFVSAYARLGQLYREGGRLERAEETYRRGLQVDPEDPVLWQGLAEVYRLLAGRVAERGTVHREWLEQSLAAYRRALDASPQDPDLHNRLGYTLQDLGRPEEALGHHRQALALAPDDARTQVNLGSAHFLLQDGAAAEQAFLRAVRADSLFAMPWYNLGVLYARQGRRVEALAAYRRAAALDTGYAENLRARIQALEGERHD